MIRRPLISYYGSKFRLARGGAYPPPLYDHIIEPFAGSAGYALQWPHLQVTLIDEDPVLAAVWAYLIGASTKEIKALPLIHPGQNIDELIWPCEEARNLAGYWCSVAGTYPNRKLSPWAVRDRGWCESLKHCIAESIEQIRHWKIICGSYDEGPQGPASRFIDAPYEGAKGRKYRHGSSKLNYPEIATWCKQQQGQLIACEGPDATWLPFKPLCTMWGSRGYSKELVYLQGPQGGQMDMFAESFA